MKQKTLIGIALVLLVSMLVSCGGVSQDEFDAAVADRDTTLAQVTSLQSQVAKVQNDSTAANTAKTKAEADLATVQASLTKVNSDLSSTNSKLNTADATIASNATKITDLNKQITDLKAQIAALQAGGGGGGGGTITPPTLSFTAATYTNTTYKFTFKYDASWTLTWNTATNPASFGAAPYYDPSVRIYVYPKATGATLTDVLKSDAIMKDYNTTAPVNTPVIGETKDNVKNVYGTTVTRIVHTYKSSTGSTAYCISYGVLKGDNWFILSCTQDSGWGITKLDPVKPDEIFSTWQFTG